jgi:hypothetical protein
MEMEMEKSIKLCKLMSQLCKVKTVRLTLLRMKMKGKLTKMMSPRISLSKISLRKKKMMEKLWNLMSLNLPPQLSE